MSIGDANFMNFLAKLYRLMDSKKIGKNALCKELEISGNSFVNWENRKTLPSAEIIIKLSNYFDVTSDYLLGLDDVQNRKTESISENAQELIEMYTQLSERNQIKIIGYVQRMLEENGKVETINEDVSKIAEADANVLTEPINTN